MSDNTADGLLSARTKDARPTINVSVVGDGGKQWGNSTIKCELLLLDEKIQYPKHTHCLEYYNDGDYDEDDNDDIIFIYCKWVSIRWQW
jgi:hypothetical protein